MRLVGDRVYERFGLPQLPSVHSRTCLAWCLAELGEFSEARTAVQESMRIADSVDHPLNLTVACSGFGTVLLRQGEAGARSRSRARADLIQKCNAPVVSASRRRFGLGRHALDWPADALAILEQALRRAERCASSSVACSCSRT
jgi:hypothetical protein